MMTDAAVCVRNAAGTTDREQATNHLRASYAATVERYPMFRADVAEAQYVRVNLRAALRNLRTGCAHTL